MESCLHGHFCCKASMIWNDTCPFSSSKGWSLVLQYVLKSLPEGVGYLSVCFIPFSGPKGNQVLTIDLEITSPTDILLYSSHWRTPLVLILLDPLGLLIFKKLGVIIYLLFNRSVAIYPLLLTNFYFRNFIIVIVSKHCTYHFFF